MGLSFLKERAGSTLLGRTAATRFVLIPGSVLINAGKGSGLLFLEAGGQVDGEGGWSSLA